jgi:hypothetical protein
MWVGCAVTFSIKTGSSHTSQFQAALEHLESIIDDPNGLLKEGGHLGS